MSLRTVTTRTMDLANDVRNMLKECWNHVALHLRVNTAQSKAKGALGLAYKNYNSIETLIDKVEFLERRNLWCQQHIEHCCEQFKATVEQVRWDFYNDCKELKSKFDDQLVRQHKFHAFQRKIIDDDLTCKIELLEVEMLNRFDQMEGQFTGPIDQYRIDSAQHENMPY